MKPAHLTFILLLACPILLADSFFDKFIDPEDGMVDGSEFVLDYPYGVLPVPIFITDPAIGNGFGVAGVYFHDPDPAWEGKMHDETGRQRPSSVTALAAGATDNESSFLGGIHLGHYKQDTIRYESVVGVADINLSFYGSGDDSGDQGGFELNAEAVFISQQLTFRLGASDWLLGGEFLFADSTIKFDQRNEKPELEELSIDNTNAALGVVLIYDSLDNPYTPSSGISSETQISRYDESFGGDFDYDAVTTENQIYFSPFENWTAGVRLDGSFVSDGAPFYGLPYIEMRGIPAMRYQGEDVVTTELQTNWNFHPRWTVLAFVGAGRATNTGISDADTHAAGGFGFRYMGVRRLGLNMGIDLAKGPEDEVIYINFGTKFD